jgi:hypothetical protein
MNTPNDRRQLFLVAVGSLGHYPPEIHDLVAEAPPLLKLTNQQGEYRRE